MREGLAYHVDPHCWGEDIAFQGGKSKGVRRLGDVLPYLELQSPGSRSHGSISGHDVTVSLGEERKKETVNAHRSTHRTVWAASPEMARVSLAGAQRYSRGAQRHSKRTRPQPELSDCYRRLRSIRNGIARLFTRLIKPKNNTLRTELVGEGY